MSAVGYATLCIEHVSTMAEERIISANHLVNHGPTAEVFSLFEIFGRDKECKNSSVEAVFYLCHSLRVAHLDISVNIFKVSS